ncbi:MAG: DUF4840 domain-containing protein [Prevotella sp.]|nr:DUF4840 domain-containing protein [Prevotella sp.]
MKTLRLFTALLCCMAAVSFTSCNNDDIKTLTPEEKLSAFNAVKGSYEGTLIYANPGTNNGKNTHDSIATHWQINTDSMLIVKDFPAAPVAAYITDSVLAKTIAAQPTQELKAMIGFYSVSPVAFLINPIAATYNVNYNGGAHKVQVAFYVNTNYSFGRYNATSKKMEMQMVIGGIYVDGKLQSSLLSSTVFFGLIATKK